MRTALLVLGAVVGFGGVGEAHAHVGRTVYPVYELPTYMLPDLHDDTLEDWDQALPFGAISYSEFVDFTGRPLGTVSEQVSDPHDLAWRVFFAWHSETQRIYGAVERLDDYYFASGDSLDGWTTIEVDADHSGGQFMAFTAEQGYAEAERKQLNNAQAQSYVIFAETNHPFSDGRKIAGGGWADPWVTSPPWSDAGGIAFGENPEYSMMEFYITPFDDLHWQGPEYSQRSVLMPGNIIGLMVHVLDHDPGGEFRHFRLGVPTVDVDEQPNIWADNFVDAELIPCDIADCGGSGSTAVVENSWGRIKATLHGMAR